MNPGYKIGIDLGGTKICAGIEHHGVIEHKRSALLTDKDSLTKSIGNLIDFIKPLVNGSVRGIGIGVPSVVDIDSGTVYNVTNIPSWKQVPIKSILQDAFNLPVFVNNDVNCFVLGEFYYGSLKGFRSVVGITLGTGLGSGIILNGKPYYGQNCGAGEIGLIPYLDRNIEYYASGNFFEVFYQTSALHMYEKALENDDLALKAWKEYGYHLGKAIQTIMYAFDPQAIVMGGSVSKAYHFFESSMLECLNEFEFPESVKKIRIFQSKDENISLLGAVAMIQ